MPGPFDALAAEFWELQASAKPTWGLILGDYRYADRMEDPSEASTESLLEHLSRLLFEARSEEAGPDDGLTRVVLISEADGWRGSLESRYPEFLVDPLEGPHLSFPNMAEDIRVPDAEVANAIVRKLEAYGSFLEASASALDLGASKGRLPVQKSCEKVLAQIDAMLSRPLEEDPLTRFQAPDGWSPLEESSWRESLGRNVGDHVRPALERYRETITNLVAVARPQEKAGGSWLPDGDEVYARAVNRYTTLDLSPDGIHEIGLEEVAALEEEYMSLAGPLLGLDTVEAIFEALRDDPTLRFETRDDLVSTAQSALHRANEAVPAWFGLLSDTPCVVAEVPEAGAADNTIAYYLPPATDGSRPGQYFINTHKASDLTRYEAEALAFHESVPGHHLQIALAQELDLPEFRKHALVTAYVEGWGLYTERLCDEMGLYSSDLARIGMLSFDSWRACRLVVDTGMHALGWGRQQAIDFMSANSPQQLPNIVNEVDRYISWPGQALAYKMGQREIWRLRREAEASAGSSFDVKAFHDAVLGSGPVPLKALGGLVGQAFGF